MIVNSSANSLPIQQSEFDKWMSVIGYFEPNPTIAVATSGGADSMALLLLAHEWARVKNGKVISLTVNHNLRKEAANEALQVKKWCENHSIEHHILCWQHSSVPPISSIQENARNARYKLMTNWCIDNNILHLLVAHHLDDQAETLFFRLARGSGLMGLACMLPHTKIYGINLLRPLLCTAKTRLIATLKAKNQEWIEDPSNQNSAYTRILIRKQLQLVNNDIFAERIANITTKFQKFRGLAENYTKKEIDNWVEVYSHGYAIINEPRKLSECSFNYLIQILSGNIYPPRSKKLDIFLKTKILTNSCKTSSFGGLLFEPIKHGRVLVYREPRAISEPCPIRENTPIIWDKRFTITANSNLTLRHLGSDGLKIVRKTNPELFRNAPPDRVLRTIPSLWLLEELVSVPHIEYMNQNPQFSELKVSIQFLPVILLAGNSFSVMNNLI